jgi:hypothetical protein
LVGPYWLVRLLIPLLLLPTLLLSPVHKGHHPHKSEEPFRYDHEEPLLQPRDKHRFVLKIALAIFTVVG